MKTSPDRLSQGSQRSSEAGVRSSLELRIPTERTSGSFDHLQRSPSKRPTLNLEEECGSYAAFLNRYLEGHPLCAHLMPLEEHGFDLIGKAADGLLLSAIISTIDSEAIDLQKLNRVKSSKDGAPAKALTVFQKTENQEIMLQAAKKIGARLVNVGSSDLINGMEHVPLVLGLSKQLMKIYMVKHLNEQLKAANLSFDQLIRKSPDSEPEAKGTAKLSTVMSNDNANDVMANFLNDILQKAARPDLQVENFSEDLKDSEVFLTVLNYLDPKKCLLSAITEKDRLLRAQAVVNNAQAIGVQSYVRPEDIVQGNALMMFEFAAAIATSEPVITMNGGVVRQRTNAVTQRSHRFSNLRLSFEQVDKKESQASESGFVVRKSPDANSAFSRARRSFDQAEQADVPSSDAAVKISKSPDTSARFSEARRSFVEAENKEITNPGSAYARRKSPDISPASKSPVDGSILLQSGFSQARLADSAIHVLTGQVIKVGYTTSTQDLEEGIAELKKSTLPKTQGDRVPRSIFPNDEVTLFIPEDHRELRDSEIPTEASFFEQERQPLMSEESVLVFRAEDEELSHSPEAGLDTPLLTQSLGNETELKFPTGDSTTDTRESTRLNLASTASSLQTSAKDKPRKRDHIEPMAHFRMGHRWFVVCLVVQLLIVIAVNICLFWKMA